MQVSLLYAIDYTSNVPYQITTEVGYSPIVFDRRVSIMLKYEEHTTLNWTISPTPLSQYQRRTSDMLANEAQWYTRMHGDWQMEVTQLRH